MKYELDVSSSGFFVVYRKYPATRFSAASREKLKIFSCRKLAEVFLESILDLPKEYPSPLKMCS